MHFVPARIVRDVILALESVLTTKQEHQMDVFRLSGKL